MDRIYDTLSIEYFTIANTFLNYEYVASYFDIPVIMLSLQFSARFRHANSKTCIHELKPDMRFDRITTAQVHIEKCQTFAVMRLFCK